MSDTRTILRSETSQELSRELAALRQRITDNMREAGEWATGKTAESMVVEIRDEADLTRGLLYGCFPYPFYIKPQPMLVYRLIINNIYRKYHFKNKGSGLKNMSKI